MSLDLLKWASNEAPTCALFAVAIHAFCSLMDVAYAFVRQTKWKFSSRLRS